MMCDNTELGSVGLLAAGDRPGDVDAGRLEEGARTRSNQQTADSSASTTTRATSRRSENGDIWITQAWSGDIFQANCSGYPHLKFVVPEAGRDVLARTT